MTENSRMAREYKRFTNNINVPPVDKNLHVRLLRNRDIPYYTRLITFDNQNSKTKKPDIPPRCSSLTINHQLTTAEISAQPPNSRNKFLASGQTFRQRFPLTPIGPEWINWTYDQVDIDKRSEIFSQTLWQDHGNMWPKTVFTPQPLMFIRDKIGLLQIISPS